MREEELENRSRALIFESIIKRIRGLEEMEMEIEFEGKQGLGKGRVALVIGASRGIGRQVAIDLAREGYKGEFYVDLFGVF